MNTTNALLNKDFCPKKSTFSSLPFSDIEANWFAMGLRIVYDQVCAFDGICQLGSKGNYM